MSDLAVLLKKHLDVLNSEYEGEHDGPIPGDMYQANYMEAEKLASADYAKTADERKNKRLAVISELEAQLEQAKMAADDDSADAFKDAFFRAVHAAFPELDREGQKSIWDDRRHKGRSTTRRTGGGSSTVHAEDDKSVITGISRVHSVERLQNGILQLKTSGRWKRVAIEDDKVLKDTPYHAHSVAKPGTTQRLKDETFSFNWKRNDMGEMEFVSIAQ